ncbi:aspartate/glutamate racemase family protein [Rugosimonospora acidiphila]|uniref:Aspartate/glutamate racemase family protein n=1 Tax=Rugosimonospora acidiphila TaxID=556531 RepID=A0ABP9SRN8_9ACTN
MSQTDDDRLFSDGYGWRARIGFLSPGAVDESSSRQFYRMAPPGVTIVRTALGVTDITPDQINEALSRAEDAARRLARTEPNCIILGGSPTVVVGGYGSDNVLVERIGRASGIQTSAAQSAAVEAMRLLGMRRIAVVTPFPDPFPELLREFLVKSGFEVPALDSLGVEYRKLRMAPLRAGYELARRTFEAAGGADGIYFAGAPFPVADIIDRLERELNTTVVSSMQCTLWKGLRMSGATAGVKIDGYGRLLRDLLDG